MAPAVEICPAASTLRVIEPMPVPPSVPLTVTETAARYQLEGQVGAPLQLIEIAGAVRSEMPFCAALLPLVNVPPPLTFAWITYW